MKENHFLRKMCFEKMLWGISETVNARAFKYLCHCVQHPENLLVGISGALGMKENPLSEGETCFWENAYGVSQKWWMLELSNLCHCVQHPWKLTSRDFWSSRNEKKPLSKEKCVLRKCCEVSQKWWILELSNLCHCIQHPWKLTSRDIWSTRNKRKPLSKEKCVLRNAVGYLRNGEC